MIQIVDESNNTLVNLDNLREQFHRKKTQKEVADGTGIDKSTVSNHYNGKDPVSLNALVKYAKYFQVSVDYLLGLSGYKTNDPKILEICEYTGLSEKAVKALHKKKVKLDEYNAKSQAVIYRERIAETEKEKTLEEEIKIQERDTRHDFFDFLSYIVETDARFLYTSKINPQLDNKTLNLNMLSNGLEQFAANPRWIKTHADNAEIHYKRGKDIVKDTQDYFQRLLFFCCEDFKRAVYNYSHDSREEMTNSRKRCMKAILEFEKLLQGDESHGND